MCCDEFDDRDSGLGDDFDVISDVGASESVCKFEECALDISTTLNSRRAND